MDVEAQDDGVMAKIVVDDGSKAVAVGTTIAIIGEEGDDISGADALAKESSEAPKETKEEKTEEPKKEETKETKETKATGSLDMPPAEKKYGSGGGSEAQKAAPTGDKPKFFASPLARKIALEQGIPLGQVKGTGPDGRIVKADVEKFKPSSSAAAKSPSSGSSTLPGSAAPAAPAEYEDIPVTNMRRTIGKRLTESKQQLPHYYLTVEVNMDRVMKLREVFNKASDGKNKLSVNDFIVKASALALAEVPEANSAWLGETIRQ